MARPCTENPRLMQGGFDEGDGAVFTENLTTDELIARENARQSLEHPVFCAMHPSYQLNKADPE
jgi:hypothetical protein